MPAVADTLPYCAQSICRCRGLRTRASRSPYVAVRLGSRWLRGRVTAGRLTKLRRRNAAFMAIVWMLSWFGPGPAIWWPWMSTDRGGGLAGARLLACRQSGGFIPSIPSAERRFFQWVGDRTELAHRRRRAGEYAEKALSLLRCRR
jgi:hypothetical protein